MITAFNATEFTVTNQGQGDAGAFTVSVTNGTETRDSVRIDGLTAGASATRSYSAGPCGGTYTAHADALGEVAESDETNNEQSFTISFC